jgi:S1-C subfamily serine protease
MRAHRNRSGRLSRSFALAATAAAIAFVSGTAAFAAENKLHTQALQLTGQLNGNCSASLIHSKRDDETGEVRTLFLTAKHCISNEKQLQHVDLPVYQNGRVVKKDRYVAKVAGRHFEHDLALVELSDKQTFFRNTVKIAAAGAIPAMGDPVVTVGYPMGLQLTVTAGLFGSLETIDYPKPGIEYFRATPDVVGGNSGGALYKINTTGDYELIGVTTLAHVGHSFVAFYTPLEAIHQYLKVAVPEAVRAPESEGAK